jgi:hypothetical protein
MEKVFGSPCNPFERSKRGDLWADLNERRSEITPVMAQLARHFRYPITVTSRPLGWRSVLLPKGALRGDLQQRCHAQFLLMSQTPNRFPLTLLPVEYRHVVLVIEHSSSH